MIGTLQKIADSEALGKSKDTKNGYNLMIGRLNKYLVHSERAGMKLFEFSEDRAQEFKEFLIEEMELANVTVNCTIQPIKSFLEKLFTGKKIPINPFYNVSYLPKHRESTFIAFYSDEKKAISELLSKNYPELYLFVNLIYSCFTRPKENVCLTPADIDLKVDWVRVRVETSKVSHTSHRQIMPGLKALISDYGILSLPKHQLVFRSICSDDNNPRSRRRKDTDLWKAVVKKKLGNIPAILIISKVWTTLVKPT